jgi:hypothetical protein
MGIANQDHRVVERPRFDERESERHLELAEDRAVRATGLMNSQYSSMKSSRIKVAARLAPPRRCR